MGLGLCLLLHIPTPPLVKAPVATLLPPTSPTSTVSLTELTLLFCKLSNAFNMVLTAVSLVPEPGKGCRTQAAHRSLSVSLTRSLPSE